MNRFFKNQTSFSNNQFWLFLFAIGILALILRLPTLASRSLWLDEAYSAWFAAVPLTELWTSVPLYETHPPMYYTLLKAWSALAGTSEPALRSMSVIASVMSVLLLGLSARLAGLGTTAQRIALLGALFLAFNASSIEYAQQARPYALQTVAASFAVLCSCVLLSKGMQSSSNTGVTYSGRLWPWAAGLGLATGCTLWLHNTGFFIALGIWAGLLASSLVFMRGNRLPFVLLIGAAGILALIVWIPFLQTFIQQGTAHSSISFWLRFNPSQLPEAWVVPSGGLKVALFGALLVLASLVWLWRVRPGLVCHLLIILLLAPLLMGAYSYFAKPIFLARLFIWTGPVLMALLALGVFALPTVARIPAAAIVVALSTLSTLSYYRKPTENWREMVAQVEARVQPGDLVLAFPNQIQLPIDYYSSRQGLASRVVYLPGPFPALGLDRIYVANLGTPAIDAEDARRAQVLASGTRRVWLIERGANLYDQNGLITAAIGANLRPVEKIKGQGMNVTLFEAETRSAAR